MNIETPHHEYTFCVQYVMYHQCTLNIFMCIQMLAVTASTFYACYGAVLLSTLVGVAHARVTSILSSAAYRVKKKHMMYEYKVRFIESLNFKSPSGINSYLYIESYLYIKIYQVKITFINSIHTLTFY